MKTQRYRKPLSVFLSLAMVLSLVPTPALAEILDEVRDGAVEDTLLEAQEGAVKNAPDESNPDVPADTLVETQDGAEEDIVEAQDAAKDAPDEPNPDVPVDAAADVLTAANQPVTGKYDYISDPMPIEPDSDIMVSYGYKGDSESVELCGLYIEGEHADGTLSIELPNTLKVDVTVNGVTSKVDAPVRKLGDNLFNWTPVEGDSTCMGLSIANVTVPSNVEEVSYWTFRATQWSDTYAYHQHVPNLESVTFAPDSHCKKLGSNFDGSPITSLVLPDHLEEIGAELCQNCANLTQIEIPATVTTIGSSAFWNTPLSEIEFPEGLTYIGSHAFASTRLESVTFPNSLKTIDREAFASCESLASVQFGTSMTTSQLETIGNAAFHFDPITKVEIPDSVKRIEDTAFGWSESGDLGPLTSVTIGSSQVASQLEYIGVRAFVKQSITSITLPNALLEMNDSSPYQYCDKFETIVWPTSPTATFTAVDGLNNLPSLKDEMVSNLPPYITTIAQDAYRKTPLERITIPSTVETIEKYAFCDSWIEELTISDGVKTIDEQAFYNNKIESIHIPASVTSIGNNAFDTQYGDATISSFTIEEEGDPLTIGNWMCRFAPGTTVVLPERVTRLGKQALVADGESDDKAVTYYIYNKDIDFWCFDDGKELDGYVSSDVPFARRSIIYYPQDTDPESDLGRLVEYSKTGEHADRIRYLTFIPFDENAPKPTYGVMGTVPAGATVRLLVAGEETVPELDDNGATASFSVSGIEEGTLVCAVVSLDGYQSLTLFPSELVSGDATGAEITDTWKFTVSENDMTPLSTLGTLRVTTDPDANNHYDNEINVAVFNRAGKLMAQGNMLRAGFFEVADLPAGDYVVIAWQFNDFVTRVSGVDDLSRLGFREGSDKDYLRKGVYVGERQVVELNLGSVPAIDVSRMTGVVDESAVMLSATKTSPDTTIYLRVRYTMAEGRTANEVRVNIPAGLIPTSAATTAKNYGIGGWNSESHVLTLGDLNERDKAGALINIGIKVEAAGSYEVSASLVSDGVTCALGSAPLSAPAIELSVPTTPLSTTSFALDVYAKADSDVTLAIGGTQLTDGPYKTNKLGHLKTTVTIPEGELGAGNYYLVTATVGEESATGVVSYRAAVSTSFTYVPRVIDFWFEHAGHDIYLAKDGEDLLGGYYTVIDKPDQHPNAYREEWPFEVVFESRLPLTDTATLRLGMADGSVRTCEMSRAKTEPQENGATRYTYRCSVKIGTGKLADRLTPKDIPCRFDVVPGFEQDVNTSLAAVDNMTFDGIDSSVALSYRYQNNLIDGIYRGSVSLGGQTTSYEDIDRAWLEWALSLPEPRRTETINSLGIFGYAYKHEVFDPDGTIWASMSEEERAAYSELENQLDELYGYIAVALGDKKPLPAYPSLEAYLEDNYGYETNQNNDRATLERQGYTIVDTTSPEWQAIWAQYGSGLDSAEQPDWVAVKLNDADGSLAAFDEGGGSTASCKTPTSSIKISYKHLQSATLGTIPSGASVTLGTVDALFPTTGPNPTVIKVGSKAISGAALVVNAVNTYNSISSYGDALSEANERRGELERINQQITYYENRGQGNSACAEALKRERDIMQPLVDTLDSSANHAAWDVGFNAASCVASAVTLAAVLAGTGVGAPVGFAILGVTAAYTAYSVMTGIVNAGKADVLTSHLDVQRAERTQQCKNADDFGNLHYYKRFNLDPSGYVFEGVENERVEGVVATIYRLVDETLDQWAVWDQQEAAEYEQVNTQTTDANGTYAWDVPMGLWKVVFTKDGYDKAETDKMEVPPEHTDVAVNMLRSDPPKVDDTATVVAADGSYVEVAFDQYMLTDDRGTPAVTAGGATVEGSSWQRAVAGRDGDGAEAALARVLRVPVPASAAPGSTLKITVSAAKSYTGKAMEGTHELTVTLPSPEPSPVSPTTVPIYRLYNKHTSEHLYTTAKGEYDQLPAITNGDWVQEGVAWNAPAKGTAGASPVWRLYNEGLGDHHYTSSEGERDALVANSGWKVEGVAFYTAAKGGDTIGLYRLYNGGLKKGQHHYTASEGERDFLVANAGWTYEGVSFYGYAKAK